MTRLQPRIVAGSSKLFEDDPVTFLLSRHSEHGDIFTVELDGVPTVIFGGAAGPAMMFRAERQCLAVYNTPAVHELFGRAAFNLVGVPHRQAHKILRQALTGTALQEMAPALAVLVEQHVERLLDVGEFDVNEATRDMTLDICTRLILGLKPGSEDYQLFPSMFARFLAGVDVSSDNRHSDPIYQRGAAAAKWLRAMIARRAALVASVADVNVISRLAVNTKLPPSDVGDHLLAVMIAVRETTSSLLTWLLIELAQLPQTVLALADEAQTLDRAVTGNMRALLWETERRHSPNILSRRVVIDNFVTPYGLVPEGWHAAYSPAVNHLFPSLFGDPVSFRPARFGGQFGMRLAASLLTFGNGIHACPGKPFAELVAVTFMTAVLRDCRLTLTSAPPANARYLPVKTPAFPVLALLRHRSNS